MNWKQKVALVFLTPLILVSTCSIRATVDILKDGFR